MSERDQRGQVTVGAEASPLDPDGRPRPDLPPAPAVDVVQAVADLVDDLVDEVDDADATNDPPLDDPGMDDGPGGGPQRS
jgi:hypothetical protein